MLRKLALQTVIGNTLIRLTGVNCTIWRQGLAGYPVEEKKKRCAEICAHRLVVHIHLVMDKSVKGRATSVTRKDATLWDGELLTDIHLTNT